MDKKFNLKALKRYARSLGFGSINTKIDMDSGLHAIIAIHSTAAGPAIGGCRLNEYPTHNHALYDVLRLSYMMTMKAAAVDLPHGGAKSVIIKPPHQFSRKDLFSSFGQFIESQGGQYIAACDVGTNTDDMDIIATQTKHVIGAAKTFSNNESPARHTARGVFLGIRAAVDFKLNRDLSSIHVAIQGAGNVGYELSRLLLEHGAQVTVSDSNPERLSKIVSDLKVNTVACSEIYNTTSDVFSPCALGGTINAQTLKLISAPIIAGCANNQLAHRQITDIIESKGILYAPDFVINAGGLIHAAMIHDYGDIERSDKKIAQLETILHELFQKSAQTNTCTVDMAFDMAQQKLQQRTLGPKEFI